MCVLSVKFCATTVRLITTTVITNGRLLCKPSLGWLGYPLAPGYGLAPATDTFFFLFSFSFFFFFAENIPGLGGLSVKRDLEYRDNLFGCRNGYL